MAAHSSTLAWQITWMEERGRLQSMGSLGVGHDWATSLSLFTFMHWRRQWQPTPVFFPGETQGRGAWWAAVSGVTQSWTQLKRLSSSSSMVSSRSTRNPSYHKWQDFLLSRGWITLILFRWPITHLHWTLVKSAACLHFSEIPKYCVLMWVGFHLWWELIEPLQCYKSCPSVAGVFLNYFVSFLPLFCSFFFFLKLLIVWIPWTGSLISLFFFRISLCFTAVS